MVDDNIPRGTEFAWDEAQRRLELQLTHAESLDSKATTLLGFLAVAFGLMVASAGALRGLGRLVGVLVPLGLGISAFFALRAFWVRGYDRSPSPEVVWRFAEREKRWIQHRLLTTRWKALTANEEILKRKAKNLKISMVALGAVGAVAIVATIISML